MSTKRAQEIITAWKKLILRYDERSTKLLDEFNLVMTQSRPRIKRKLIPLGDNFVEVMDDRLNKTVMAFDEMIADTENKLMVSPHSLS